MLKHLVKKMLMPIGYAVQRADEIVDVGQITHQRLEGGELRAPVP